MLLSRIAPSLAQAGFLAVLCLLVTPPSAQAQFQQPTAEELRMTSDPKAPGADAVYLYYEEISNDTSHFHSVYARIKILDDKAKSLGNVTLETGFFHAEELVRLISKPEHRDFVNLFFKTRVANVSGRTIHPDGTIIPLTAKPETRVLFNNKDQELNQTTFSLPEVEVGSILEYRYQIQFEDEDPDRTETSLTGMQATAGVIPTDWLIQKPYFVHKSHYFFTPYQSNQRLADTGLENMDRRVRYTSVLPAGANIVVDAFGRYSFDANDVPPLPQEASSSPTNNFVEQIHFFYPNVTSAENSTSESDNAGSYWAAEAGTWSNRMNHFSETTAGLKDAAATLVAGTTTDAEKARKLYDAVMALDNSDFAPRSVTAELKKNHFYLLRGADEVWKQKSGTSDELALLYIALARAAGLHAYAAQVVDRDRGAFNPLYLSPLQLDDVLVIVEINGKQTLLDPGARFCPYGQVAWPHNLATGLRQSSAKPGIFKTPPNPYTEASLLHMGDLALDANGAVSGNVRFILHGPMAIEWRQKAQRDGEDAVTSAFGIWASQGLAAGLSATFDHFAQLNDSQSDLVGIVKISGSLPIAAGGSLSIPARLFDSESDSSFAIQPTRQNPVDLHLAATVKDEITWRLPAGLALATPPQDRSIPWPGHAIYKLKTTSEPGSVTVTRTLARAFAFLEATDYPQLHDFYQKVAAADRQPIVLSSATKPSATKPDKGE